MKRFHVHVAVRDLAESVRFYSTLFGAPPAVEKPDYAKWMLEDPRLNFAISTGSSPGIEHLGLQADSLAELAGMRAQVAGRTEIVDEPRTTCCYADSSKHWVSDPQGIRWETFHTFNQVDGKACSPKAACCG